MGHSSKNVRGAHLRQVQSNNSLRARHPENVIISTRLQQAQVTAFATIYGRIRTFVGTAQQQQQTDGTPTRLNVEPSRRKPRAPSGRQGRNGQIPTAQRSQLQTLTHLHHPIPTYYHTAPEKKAPETNHRPSSTITVSRTIKYPRRIGIATLLHM